MMLEKTSCPSDGAGGDATAPVHLAAEPCSPAGDAPPVHRPTSGGDSGGVDAGQGAQIAPDPGPPLEEVSDESVGGFSTVAAVTSDAALNWQEGQLVADRFRILRFIGQGGMGKVFLAQDETLARPLALKCIPQEIIFDGDARDDLRQEANRLLDLAHENIVRIHTYYDGPTWPFFAMEYLHGPTLKELLRARKHEGRTFSGAEVLAVARHVARGLEHAHTKGIIHRDLKPGNLMLAEAPGGEIKDADTVKITDFGVSRVVADSTLRHTGKRSGTLPYMSPEQFRGEPCTVRSDIYSFACTLYDLLDGKPPFHTGDIGYQILHKPPRPLQGLPAPVGEAILRGLAKNPRERFESVAAFLSALEGKARVSRPRGGEQRAGRWWQLSLTSKAAVGILLVLAVSFMVVPYLRDGARENRKSGLTSPEPLRLGRDGFEPRPDERLQFVKKLQTEIERQVPLLLSRKFPLLAATSPDGKVTLRFDLPEPKDSNYQRDLFDRLLLQYYSTDPSEKKPLVHGTILEGKKVFLFDGLKEGSYTVWAFIERTEAGAGVIEPLINQYVHRFRIDLTPPSFQVEPLDPDVFVSATPPTWSTFDEVVDVEVRSRDGPEDIEGAYFQTVFGQQASAWARIPDHRRWQLKLPPGTTTYGVVAEDKAGNRSAAFQVSFRRLRLQLESFGIAGADGVQGNLATVGGILRVEGEQSPALRYFMNGQPVVPLPASGSLFRDDASSPFPGPEGIPFSAVLRLPDSSNDIVVRYVWGESAPKEFAPPAVITGVKVRAPQIFLSSELPLRTNKPTVEFAGRVEPYFEGLEMSLEMVGQQTRTVYLARQPSGPTETATFSVDVRLSQEGENLLRVRWFYAGSEVGPTPPLRAIYGDKVPPVLECVFNSDPQRNLLRATLRPSETLAQLRVQEVSGSGESDVWIPLEPVGSKLEYVHVTTLSPKPLTLRIEMRDLAGNEVTVGQFCPLTSQDADAGAFARTSGKENGEVQPAIEPGGSWDAGDAEEAPRAERSAASPAAPGVTVIASPWIRNLEMDFVPIGQDRLEMGRSEVPERAWFRFLREKKGYEHFGAGRTDFAMTLADFPPDLLREFVKWFGEKAADGYTYKIPTKEEWLLAFAGVSDPERARELIADWFKGTWKGKTHFEPSPEVRYGINRVVRMGSRRENRTPTDLLDMEANLEELVLDGEVFKAIGGSNRDEGKDLSARCLDARPYDAAGGRFTGLRLVRKPLLSR
ncbi:MAG TPA: serine/threonine-protein kinase [Planctomycetota bacterium]|nr:serine/threonine-protein kinase [Planctomycetota bacterium]